MRTIETTVRVEPDGTASLRVPADVPPGEHRAVLVLGDEAEAPSPRPPLELSAYPVGLAIPTTFRREELYGGLRAVRGFDHHTATGGAILSALATSRAALAAHRARINLL